MNLSSFLPGGRCVNSQNVIVDCANSSAVAAAIGNFGRNLFRGPFQTNHDMSLVKITKLTENTNLEFRAEFFNLFNIVNFGLPNNIVTGSGFGFISKTAGTSRQIQFSLKLLY